MLNVIKPSKFTEHIRKTHEALEASQWQDQYEVNLKMIKPFLKKAIPPELVTSATVNFKSLKVESTPIGTTSIKRYTDSSSDDIELVIRNPIELNSTALLGYDENLTDYFLTEKGTDGKGERKNIIPTDGTFILLSEYYFQIEVFALNARWKKKLLTNKFYVLDTDFKLEFSSSTSEISTIPLTFKPTRFT